MAPDVILCDDFANLPSGDGPGQAVWLWQQNLTGKFDRDVEE